MTHNLPRSNELISRIMEICKESGAIAELERDHYQKLITMDNAEMHQLIRMLIFSMQDIINNVDQWETEDKLLDQLGTSLSLIMSGMMYFSETGEQVIAKPSRMPTDDERQQLRNRAEAERETIRQVLWEILDEQTEIA